MARRSRPAHKRRRSMPNARSSSQIRAGRSRLPFGIIKRGG
nr:MAG TPA: hypothetical protein [Caudoviricetes sp.]